MIEKLFRNELSLKRYRRFKRSKAAIVAVLILAVLCFFSFTAEFWANNKPIYLKYHGKSFYPVFKTYHPTEFGIEDAMVTDYRALQLSDGDSAIWPVIKWDAFESNQSVDEFPSGPSKENILGTDDRGRDVFTRLLYGFRYSMGYAIAVWLISFIFGTAVGALCGYIGGKFDIVGSRFVEVFEMVPRVMLMITVIAVFNPNIFLLIMFGFMFDWFFIFHQMRSQFFQLRKREYVEAARAIGSSHFRVIFKHVLPNAMTPLVTFSPFAVANNIYGLAMLDYLGLGLRAPTPSWGELLQQGQKFVTTAEWLVWSPLVAMIITMTSMITIGLAVRDAYDAKA